MAIRTVRSWAEYRRALVIVAVIFMVIAVWGILTSDPGDHSLQRGMIVGCGLLVAVLLIGDAIQRRRKRENGSTVSK